MARIGVSFEQVAAAADSLLGAGRQPTIQAVREALGTGSPNTIHRHLSDWRASRPRAATSAVEVPSELSAAFLSALDRTAAAARAEKENQIVTLQAEAAELATVGEALEAERDALAEQVVALTTDRDRWEATAAERQAEIERQVAELLRERTAAEQARIETAQSRNKLELQAERLAEQVAEIGMLRTSMDCGQQARQQAEQIAAVAAARLEAAAARLEAEIEQRKALADQLAEAAKRATITADQLSHERLSGQACQARLESAAREISAANEAATKARAEAKKASEEAARLAGQLDVLLRQLGSAERNIPCL